MNVIKLIFISLLSLCCLTASAQVDALDTLIDSFGEQPLIVDWIMENSTTPLTEKKALAMVKDVYKYSFANQLDPLLVLAVMKQESNFNPRATSVVGAKGLLQVWPKWHKTKLGKRNPYDITVSIEVGTEILKECFTKHQDNTRRSLSCYSGGAKDYHKKVNTYQRAIKKYVADANRARTLLMAGG